MTMNPLPPQAYTKETMLKAYQWLMVQNSSIKEMATTPDILVSLYLKATRDGSGALERPSIQNFKNELKSLAGIMGELDRPATQAPGSLYEATVVTPTPIPQTQVASAPPPPSISQAPTQTQVSYTEKTLTATTRHASFMEQLDECSQGMIHEVKEAFNLSSDLEALRMLVKIGHGRTKDLLR